MNPSEGDSVTLKADEVLLCLGIAPNVELGRQAGLQLDDQRGGILVDSELKTNVPDVFAAGDVASYTDMILGQTRSEVLGSCWMSRFHTLSELNRRHLFSINFSIMTVP